MQTMRQIIETFLKNEPHVKNCSFNEKIQSIYFEFIGKNAEHEIMINWSDFNKTSMAFISIMSSTSIMVPFEKRCEILEFLNYTNGGEKRISRFILQPSGFIFSVCTIYANTDKILNESVLNAIFLDTLYYEDVCHPINDRLISSSLTLEEAISEFHSQFQQ
jgi:hypothetical protein